MGLFLGLAAAFRSIYQKIQKLQEWMRDKKLRKIKKAKLYKKCPLSQVLCSAYKNYR